MSLNSKVRQCTATLSFWSAFEIGDKVVDECEPSPDGRGLDGNIDSGMSASGHSFELNQRYQQLVGASRNWNLALERHVGDELARKMLVGKKRQNVADPGLICPRGHDGIREASCLVYRFIAHDPNREAKFKKERKLELAQVLQSDAAELVAARTKALLIHGTGDIDACGDEVEMAARTVLRRKLPAAYYVGHGHILDVTWTSSPQFDVILADGTGTPILFQGENGTEYFPYESVYAVGEVKTTYRKSKKYVEAFSDSLSFVRNKLRREATLNDSLPGGIKLGRPLRVDDKRPLRNPLFSFMLFVDSGDFHPNDLRALFSDRPASELPNVICFLDRGILMYMGVSAVFGPDGPKDVQFGGIDLYPEFAPRPSGVAADQRLDCRGWVFRTFESESHPHSGSFGFLYFALTNHLRVCVLQPPDMFAYLTPAFAGSSHLSVVSLQKYREGDMIF